MEKGLLAPSSTQASIQPGQQPKIAPRPDKIPLTLSASCAVCSMKSRISPRFIARATLVALSRPSRRVMNRARRRR